MTSIRVIGLGLIGGSIALRARQEGFAVSGFDADPGALAEAQRVRLIDRVAPAGEPFSRDSIVVLAMPVDAVVTYLRDLARAGASGAAAIMDVASVKAPIVAAADGLGNFVATHPLAGNEKHGPGAADARLFEGKTWPYVPARSKRATAAAVEFIRALGGVPAAVDAEEHDAVVARTSHLPQILAWIFAERMRALDAPKASELCGPVARELLRIGRVQPPMWASVLQHNSRHVKAELRAFAAQLDDYIRNTP